MIGTRDVRSKGESIRELVQHLRANLLDIGHRDTDGLEIVDTLDGRRSFDILDGHRRLVLDFYIPRAYVLLQSDNVNKTVGVQGRVLPNPDLPSIAPGALYGMGGAGLT